MYTGSTMSTFGLPRTRQTLRYWTVPSRGHQDFWRLVHVDEERLRGACLAWRGMAVRALAAVYSYWGQGRRKRDPDSLKRCTAKGNEHNLETGKFHLATKLGLVCCEWSEISQGYFWITSFCNAKTGGTTHPLYASVVMGNAKAKERNHMKTKMHFLFDYMVSRTIQPEGPKQRKSLISDFKQSSSSSRNLPGECISSSLTTAPLRQTGVSAWREVINLEIKFSCVH